ncbi:MAG: DUF4097 family beta strand repeat-containing protein [Spirosomaceae bacterium]|nr:DUF4097 family beta strand repeat-containing protein [Spirosomataceae bacterium]
MKKLLLTAALMVVWGGLFAQTTFNQPVKNTTKHVLVFIERNSLVIEGKAKNEVSIEIEQPIKLPEMAEGLKRLYVKGLNDNTSLGLSVSQEDSVMIIREACNCHNGTYQMSIPQNLNLTVVEHSGNQWGGKWTIRNLAGNVNLNTEFGNIYLENLTGKINTHSRHGKISAVLESPKTTSISSTYGKVDIVVSPTIKADFVIKSCQHGEVFSDFEGMKFDEEQKEITAKINGGGSMVSLKSEYGNVFVRKNTK